MGLGFKRMRLIVRGPENGEKKRKEKASSEIQRGNRLKNVVPTFRGQSRKPKKKKTKNERKKKENDVFAVVITTLIFITLIICHVKSCD